MKSSPEDRLAIQLSSYSVFLPVLLTFALLFLLTACAGVSSSSKPNATTAPTTKGRLSLAPAMFDFGTVLLNSVATSVVRVTNVGTSTDTIESATIAPTSVFSIPGWTGAVTLAPGQTVELQTNFAPHAAGNFSGTLTLAMLQNLVSTNIPLTGEGSVEIGGVPVVGVGISLLPSSLALQSGQSKQFTATVTGASNTAVTWTAQLGSITSSGDYTAPTVTTPSYDTVSAISVEDSTKYASGTVTITSTSSTGAAYSQNANSVTTKPLPSDVLSHCFGDTSNCAAGDAIAKCAMLDANGSQTCSGTSFAMYPETSNASGMGNFVKASPGSSDQTMTVYQSASTDPWYSITAATPSGLKTVQFRAPSQAKFPEGPECNIEVWDQLTGYVVSIYAYSGTSCNVILPPTTSCGSTQALACSITGFTYKSAASNFFTSQDSGYYSSSQSSGQFAPGAGTLREEELQSGSINHALLVTVECVSNTTPFVFPGIAAGLGQCGSGSPFGPASVNRISADALLFCDYTPTQILGFGLPAWQATILTAFCTYGAYPDITQGGTQGIGINSDEEMESTESWKFYNSAVGCTLNGTCYNDSFWPWIEGQKGLNAVWPINGNNGCVGGSGTNPSAMRCIGAFLTGIPRAIGPEGNDAEGNSCTSGSGCYPSGHIHVADVCIANGFANRAGGCS